MHTITIPASRADKVRAELTRRLHIDPTQVVAGSLVMHWDSDGGRVEWRGVAHLADDEVVDILAATLGAGA